MKKVIIIILILVGVGLVAVVTCPDRQDHKDAIMAVVNESINDELKPTNEEDAGLSVLFGSIGSSVVNYFIDNRLTIKNHFVYSTGVFKDLEGEEKTVSVGVFGHVFTFKKEDIKEYLVGE